MGELSEKIEGIGPSYEKKLIDAGVQTVEDLREIDALLLDNETDLGVARLKLWQSMAILQRVDGIDTQFSEGLVKSGITNLMPLTTTDADLIVSYMNELEMKGVIPEVPTVTMVNQWKDTASTLLQEQEDQPSKLAFEVDVVWEAMTCRGMRNYYEAQNHPCHWFHQFGPFHAYDVKAEDSLKDPEGYIYAFYAGRRFQIPEILSGCRKAPIMSIGLNPNLRAVTQPDRIYPYMDDVQQFAKHFRYRTNYKYSIEDELYEQHINQATNEAEFEPGEFISLKKEYVSMYNEYTTILNTFRDKVNITGSNLALGEDVSYYNFVACHSPRWDMDSETEAGIVEECFHSRQYFLQQLRQSSPKIAMLFGKPIMESFVNFFKNDFDQESGPDPNSTYEKILENNNYVMTLDGKRIRIIFSPHPTGARPWYVRLNALTKITEALEDEYEKKNLEYDSRTKHLKRSEGPCEFCNNDLFFIGNCPYR